MSVYTPVSPDQLGAFLQCYSVGRLIDYHGIRDGVENTNYFISTTEGEFVLTLFEKLRPAELDYFFSLQGHLAARGIPCPNPLTNNQRQSLSCLCHKPAALFQRLPGNSTASPNPAQCEAVGSMLARLHRAAGDFKLGRPNPRDLRWMRECAENMGPHLSEAQAALLDDELRFHSGWRSNWQLGDGPGLPTGAIHADLFCDNLLFDEDNQISGVLDFYDACTGALVYDLAVTVNAWSGREDGSLQPELANAMVRAYSQERALTQAELRAWPVMLRRAALRFWLSRLLGQRHPPEGVITQSKPPEVFEILLSNHIQGATTIAKPVDNFVD